MEATGDSSKTSSAAKCEETTTTAHLLISVFSMKGLESIIGLLLVTVVIFLAIFYHAVIQLGMLQLSMLQ